MVFGREPSASILELHLNRCKKWTISSAKTSPKKTKLKRNLGIKKSKKHQKKTMSTIRKLRDCSSGLKLILNQGQTQLFENE
jgi:hypothetical protein